MSFDAGSLQAFATVASAASTVTGAFGAYSTGQANAGAASYQAAVARNNAAVAEQNAQYALQSGRIEEQTRRQKTAGIIGEQRAKMAASGIDIGSGTPLNLQESTAQVGELDALTIRNNAMRKAYGYRVQASDFDANAGLLDMQASNIFNPMCRLSEISCAGYFLLYPIPPTLAAQ